MTVHLELSQNGQRYIIYVVRHGIKMPIEYVGAHARKNALADLKGWMIFFDQETYIDHTSGTPIKRQEVTV